MLKGLKKILAVVITGSLILSGAAPVFAAQEPEINATSAILIEQETGKVLYEKNADARVYPASMTKILTAVELLDSGVFALDDIIVTGSEVHSIPADSSKAGHQQGESISVLNLIRALMLPSGNETGCVVASAVAKKVTGNEGLDYANAEKIFCDMMNETAKGLGAVNTNFVNPHGYHDDDHYTTARDMALISRYAMENEVIAQVSLETEYKGNGAGDIDTEGLKTQEYDWISTNFLLRQTDFYYPYAKGIKTGFTNEAGRCFAGAAEKDGKKLISVVFNSEEEHRWEDTIALFEYGFDNFDYVTVQTDGASAAVIDLKNPMLGELETMEALYSGGFTDFLSQEEIQRIEKRIEFDPEKYYIPEDEDGQKILDEKLFYLPINQGEVLGTVTYLLDGNVIFESELLAAAAAKERSFSTDADYYFGIVKENAFTVTGVVIILAAVFVLLVIILLIRRLLRGRRDRYSYSYKSRRW